MGKLKPRNFLKPKKDFNFFNLGLGTRNYSTNTEITTKDFRIKATFRCPQKHRDNFNKSNVILPISVNQGQGVHEGKKFEATLALVNKFFNGCVLLIDDTIQRWTKSILQKNLSLNELRKQTLNEGKEWKGRNQTAIDQLTIPTKILTWDHWLSDKDFPTWLDEVRHLYILNKDYAKKVNSTIDEFLNRFQRHHGVFTTREEYECAFELCKLYLFEECACMCLWVKEKCEFELYPSERNLAMASTYQYLIKPFHPELLKPISLRFHKKQMQGEISVNEVENNKKNTSNESNNYSVKVTNDLEIKMIGLSLVGN